MGRDYYAITYLGIPVEEGDFIEQVQRTRQVGVSCDHPEAVGNNFCPICGARGEHTVTETVPRWKQKVSVALRKSWADDPDDFSVPEANIQEFAIHDEEILDIPVQLILRSNVDNEGQLLYGFQIGQVHFRDFWDRDEMPQTPWDDLSDKREALEKAALMLGLTGQVQLLTNLYISK